MKMRCIGAIGSDYTFKSEGGGLPQVGFLYELEDISEGTKRQNKAFHSLLNAFYNWMIKNDQFSFEYSGSIITFPARSAEDFREFFKYRYGEGATHFQYVDENYEMQKVKTVEEIPAYVLEDQRDGHRLRIKAVVKSWSNYTKRQRMSAIDRLIDLIKAVSCHDKKVIEIMRGFEGE